MDCFRNKKWTAMLLCAASCISLAACSSGGVGGSAVGVISINVQNDAGETEGLVFFGEKQAAEPVDGWIIDHRHNLEGSAAAVITYSPDMEEPVTYVQEVEEFYSLYRVEEDSTELISDAVLTYRISSDSGTIAYVDTEKQLYLYDEGKKSSVLIDTVSTEYFAISPNGECVAYTIETGEGYQTNVYRNGSSTAVGGEMTKNCMPVAVPNHGEFVYAVQGADVGTGDLMYLSTEGVTFIGKDTACHFLLNRTHEEILFFSVNENFLFSSDTLLRLAKGDEVITLFEYGLEHIDNMELLHVGECENWTEVRNNYADTYFTKTCNADHFDGETLVFSEYVDIEVSPFWMFERRQTVYLDEKGALSEKEVTNYRLNNYQLSHYQYANGTVVGEVQKIAEDATDYINAGDGALYYVTADAELYYWTEADGAVLVDTDTELSLWMFGDVLLYHKYLPDSGMTLFSAEKGVGGGQVMGNLNMIRFGAVTYCCQTTEEGEAYYLTTDGKNFKLLYQK